MVQVKFKVWLEDGETIFGEGLCTLLAHIDNLGSINRASGRLRMSYRQAWGMIRKAEQRLGITLLNREIGGESGGGADLTPAARELMDKYQRLMEEVSQAVEAAYAEIF